MSVWEAHLTSYLQTLDTKSLGPCLESTEDHPHNVTLTAMLMELERFRFSIDLYLKQLQTAILESPVVKAVALHGVLLGMDNSFGMSFSKLKHLIVDWCQVKYDPSDFGSYSGLRTVMAKYLELKTLILELDTTNDRQNNVMGSMDSWIYHTKYLKPRDPLDLFEG
ncbi:hypothetical protein P154DRAFT_579680 [Amniculicola lignicola CBS 123094]|uniref:Uncharacterized protein n=1 Tax=Amniculicola lignicola CBS 123094 TaxID=1392246 RepID=A0A6A5W4G6_9PLEO|nr:hypothetical protein P154DRAFT_579680 [Amniculicola lignicola CBS 123094]